MVEMNSIVNYFLGAMKDKKMKIQLGSNVIFRH